MIGLKKILMVNNYKKIKVCHCFSSDMTARFILLDRLKFLLSKGYDVYVTCSDGKWIKDIEQEGIKVKTIGFKRKAFSPISDTVSFIKLFFYFKQERFDIVHTHTLKPEFFGQIAAKMAGVPIIMNTIHGLDFKEEDNFIKKQLIVILQRISASCSDIIFVIAKHLIDRLIEKKIGKKSKIVYLGRDIDTGRFDLDRFDSQFIQKKKSEIGIKEDYKIIGIVARLVKEKGYLELFKAFEQVVKKFPKTVLLIVGLSEPEKKDFINIDEILDSSIGKNIVYVGDQDNVEEFYAVMDIFVLPTYREGLGASILEASAMQKPVIVTNTGGCPEAIEDDITGFLIPVGDSSKIEEKIEFLLNNSDKALIMGKAGRRKILKEYKKEIIFERFWRYYQDLINNKLER